MIGRLVALAFVMGMTAVAHGQVSPGTMIDKFANAREKAEGLSAAYASIAAEMKCAFFDAAPIIRASDIDGVHLDADQHPILGRQLVEPVRKLL